MVYRIRYKTTMSQAAENETEVEANTPTEAMVKFRGLQCVSSVDRRQSPAITSVRADTNPDDRSW